MKRDRYEALWQRWNSLKVVVGSTVIVLYKATTKGQLSGPYVTGVVLSLGKESARVKVVKSSWHDCTVGAELTICKEHIQLAIKNGNHPVCMSEDDFLKEEKLIKGLQQLSLF